MRLPLSAFVLGIAIAGSGCTQDTPTVTNNIYPPGSAPTSDVPYGEAYEVDEGGSLDLVVAITPGATVEAVNLPVNAALTDGVLTFRPSFSQAGTYSITINSTLGDKVSSTTIGVRVRNVIHIAGSTVSVNEGGVATLVVPPSDDPLGTFVQYEADVSGVAGASFDAVTRTITFAPDWEWRDTKPTSVPFSVTAVGQELDGRVTTSQATVVFDVVEKTSFTLEILPLFKCHGRNSDCGIPPATKALADISVGGERDCAFDGCDGYNGYMTPPYVDNGDRGRDFDPRGHMCIFCHSNTDKAQANSNGGADWVSKAGVLGNLNLYDKPYQELMGNDGTGAPVSQTGFPNAAVMGSDPLKGTAAQTEQAACGGPGSYAVANNLKLVTPGDPSKSLLYLKISGTDGNGAAFPSTGCGTTMPNATLQFYQQLYCLPPGLNLMAPIPSRYACDLTHDSAGELCAPNDIACRENSPDVRKIRVWIMQGAPNN